MNTMSMFDKFQNDKYELDGLMFWSDRPENIAARRRNEFNTRGQQLIARGDIVAYLALTIPSVPRCKRHRYTEHITSIWGGHIHTARVKHQHCLVCEHKRNR